MRHLKITTLFLLMTILFLETTTFAARHTRYRFSEDYEEFRRTTYGTPLQGKPIYSKQFSELSPEEKSLAKAILSPSLNDHTNIQYSSPNLYIGSFSEFLNWRKETPLGAYYFAYHIQTHMAQTSRRVRASAQQRRAVMIQRRVARRAAMIQRRVIAAQLRAAKRAAKAKKK